MLINQATVASAGGFAQKVTEPGSATLSGDPGGQVNSKVILIRAGDVVLDRNGFKVYCAVADDAT